MDLVISPKTRIILTLHILSNLFSIYLTLELQNFLKNPQENPIFIQNGENLIVEKLMKYKYHCYLKTEN